jgi:crotonobetainyl-CoA:carnitine CoA-transferase CaiB-like acyl-CoA transferase
MPHPTLGPLPQIANPVRRNGEAQRANLPPPRLGEHTDAVLTELGLDAAAIRQLREQGAAG